MNRRLVIGQVLGIFLLFSIIPPAHGSTGVLNTGQPDCPVSKTPLQEFPDCVNLPLDLSASVIFDKIEKIDEAAETFFSKFDLVFRWNDPRLKFDDPLKYGVRKDYMAQDAVTRLQEIWKPEALFNNAVEEVRSIDNALAIHADGTVVWSRRLVGKFRSEFDLNNFPFDKQNLRIQMTLANLPSRSLQFVHRDAERRRSMISSQVNDDDTWNFKDLKISTAEQRTINGDVASNILISLTAQRNAGAYIPQVFLPLIVTILLPLLGLWVLNTEIHERINWSITGVFSLIALNFSVSLQYPALGPDSLVMQFFWIGYGLQCVMFTVLLIFYNIPVAEALFSRWVHQSVMQWIRWAIPTVTIAMMGWAMALASW